MYVCIYMYFISFLGFSEELFIPSKSYLWLPVFLSGSLVSGVACDWKLVFRMRAGSGVHFQREWSRVGDMYICYCTTLNAHLSNIGVKVVTW